MIDYDQAYLQGYNFPVDNCPYTDSKLILAWQKGKYDSLIDEMADDDWPLE